MNSEISKYTISVYELQDNNFDFGLNNYPIFDEAYRPILNDAILNYYMFREIGFANPYVWRDRLRFRLSLVMRNKYNALYKAKQIEFNPLFNVDMTETFTHTINNTGEATNNGEVNYTTSSTNTIDETSGDNASNLSLSSQFPSEEMTENDLTSNLFVDSATKNTSTDASTTNTEQTNSGTDKTTNTSNGTNTSNMDETYTRKTEGSSAGLPFSRAMLQLKDYYDKYELDQQVIDELKDLFITCW